MGVMHKEISAALYSFQFSGRKKDLLLDTTSNEVSPDSTKTAAIAVTSPKNRKLQLPQITS